MTVKHKSKKMLYFILAVAAVAVLLTAVFLIVSKNRVHTDADFGIVTYKSDKDADGDGIDDQTDMLAATRAYISTKPKYKSAYYATGYPDDGYGVCTDVVAFAMRDCGYDLMQLVDEDIRANRDSYDIDKIDKKIDFRRVRNLKVYFDLNAIKLTTDTSDISEWQGGDIVIFENHIAVVSDVRNSDGVPYIIHNASPLQIEYEENALEKCGQIYGHYRIS